MKRTLLLLVLSLSLTSVAFAADFTGILMDKMCKVDSKEDAKGHDKDCNLMPDCIKSLGEPMAPDATITSRLASAVLIAP